MQNGGLMELKKRSETPWTGEGRSLEPPTAMKSYHASVPAQSHANIFPPRLRLREGPLEKSIAP